MSDIEDMAAFAEERLGEDEGKAENLATATCLAGARPDFFGAGGPAAEDYWGHFTPARMLGDIAAKRRIVTDCRKYAGGEREFNPDHARYGTPFRSPAANLAFRTLRSLVSEWGGHPAYKAAWKP